MLWIQEIFAAEDIPIAGIEFVEAIPFFEEIIRSQSAVLPKFLRDVQWNGNTREELLFDFSGIVEYISTVEQDRVLETFKLIFIAFEKNG